MNDFPHGEPQLFGTATIGEKGQIVIPVEARKKLNLQSGDKLIVIGGPHDNALMLMRPEQVMKFAAALTMHMSKMMEAISIESEAADENATEASGKNAAGDTTEAF